MSKAKGWYVGEDKEEVSEDEAQNSDRNYDFVSGSNYPAGKAEIVRWEVARMEAEGRKVIVICGSNARALSALAGTGGLVTVLLDKVEEMEDMEESRDWSLWKSEEVEALEARYMSKVKEEEFNGCLQVYSEGKDVSDAKRRKAWQTCYGPAERGGLNKNSWRGRNYRKGYIGQ